MSLQLRANAKINLGLRIVGRRDDPSGRTSRTGGYHLLHTLFQEIGFGDEITISARPDNRLTMEITGQLAAQVPAGDDNLCLLAARLLHEESANSTGAHITLNKLVPPGAGLGGGSSDAAAVLRGLNDLWQLGLSTNELETLAVRLGADVPFFIRGGLQLGEGIGEVLTPLVTPQSYTILLALPSFGVDTAWAYRQFTRRQSFPPSPLFDQLITQDPIPWEQFTNDFEEVVFPHHGKLAEIKGRLLDAGAVYAGLSGSGSTMFGLFNEISGAIPQLEKIPNCRVIVTGPAIQDLNST